MIEHQGIIEKISGSTISVKILQQSACSACHAKGACMSADSKEKIVDVTDFSGKFNVNDRVVIAGQESMSYKAILWAFVLPLLFIVAMLIVAVEVWKVNDTSAAILSMGALIPYYIILYFTKDKMAKTFKFSIKKDN